MSGFDDATRAQIRAADPVQSTWLSANAGSGKTRVLTNRVARLLLNGVPPENVLCLTFTKAAASEMQIRLFETLGAWAMLEDSSLREALRGIGEAAPDDLRTARTLFARAIEAPGGLKIQTIHSFCSGLLRAFPLEAGIAPQFTEMDEAAQARVLSDVGDRLASIDPGGAFSRFARLCPSTDPADLMAAIATRRTDFNGPLPTRGEILEAGGAPKDISEHFLLEYVDADADLLDQLKSAMLSGTDTEKKTGAKLPVPGRGGLSWQDFLGLEAIFLTAAGTRRKKFPNKDTRDAIDGDALDALMDRVEQARDWRMALDAAEQTLALHHLAREMLPLYEDEKARLGLLDFDDLILKAASLLEDSEAAEWVLYRLDGTIDHILVDEAQDTSPAQWRVIEHLTRELAAGEGARAVKRSLFVVGDKKQSIYSFQGADAAAFDGMREFFEKRLRAAGGLNVLPLLHSFRSAPAILRMVDACFPPGQDEGLGDGTRHIAFFDRLPGRVDLWPLVPVTETEEDPDWTDPVDGVSKNHQSVILADKIASELKRMIHIDRVVIPAVDKRTGQTTWRRMTEGDVLILVQSRSGMGELFPNLIRACKSEGLAIAGADRLRLSAELAVRDLRALLAFIALPEDSLSLATVLRSPLFGLSEDDLFRLAYNRGKVHLWRVLQDQRNRFPDVVATLEDVRDSADFLRPYDLLERILVRHDGRPRLVARLGPECEDGIDELLSQALAFERQDVPDLTRFLAWLEGEDTEIKRQVDAGGDTIQVMTVHGAKGLERPVVILPDTHRKKSGNHESFATLGPAGTHWRPAKNVMPEGLGVRFQKKDDAGQEERNRLLYVAMTRAESWLIICGADSDRAADQTWYTRARDGMERAEGVALKTPTGDGRRLEDDGWNDQAPAPEPPKTSREVFLPAWWNADPMPEAGPAKTIAPSSLPGEKALPGEAVGLDENSALLRGRQMHRLLEHLPAYPATDHADLAVALLSNGDDAATEDVARDLAGDVTRLLRQPELASVFAPGTLAEVVVTADVPELGGRIHGAIDRLVLDHDRVMAVDFKTNRIVPDGPGAVPRGILSQLAAYSAALADIYPDRDVIVAILWTATGTLMEIPHEIVIEALADYAIS